MQYSKCSSIQISEGYKRNLNETEFELTKMEVELHSAPIILHSANIYFEKNVVTIKQILQKFAEFVMLHRIRCLARTFTELYNTIPKVGFMLCIRAL